MGQFLKVPTIVDNGGSRCGSDRRQNTIKAYAPERRFGIDAEVDWTAGNALDQEREMLLNGEKFSGNTLRLNRSNFKNFF